MSEKPMTEEMKKDLMAKISAKMTEYESELNLLRESFIRRTFVKGKVQDLTLLAQVSHNSFVLSKIANFELGYMDLGRKINDIGTRLAKVEKICATQGDGRTTH